VIIYTLQPAVYIKKALVYTGLMTPQTNLQGSADWVAYSIFSSSAVCTAVMLMALFAAMSTWIALVYGMKLHDMVGREVEEAVVREWSMALVIEIAGIQMVYIVIIRMAVGAFMRRIQSQVIRDDPAWAMYEDYVDKHLPMRFKQESDMDVENIAQFETLA